MKLSLATIFLTLFFLPHCSTKNSIQEEEFVTLGGIEQWITIHGEKRNAPLLLIVHGGPGDAQSGFTNVYTDYEQKFVVVQWDQRGAGKTFGLYHEQTPKLTIEQLTNDGIELTEYLKKRFPKNNLIVLGHSLGSAIATGMVLKRPDLFKAYVGTGQIASWAESVQWLFNFMKSKAIESKDNSLLNELNKIGSPDPANADQFFHFTRTRRKYLDSADLSWFDTARKELKEFPDTEVNNLEGGMNFSGKTLLPYQLQERLSTDALNFKIPYLIIQGADDLFTPTEPAKNYFDKIVAPSKKMVVIQNAGHFAFVTNRQRFIGEIEKFIKESSFN